MYAGKVVESGTTEDLMTSPRHPYTVGLLRSVPSLDEKRGTPLIPISGAPPNLVELPEYCAFYPRCPYARDICQGACPGLELVGDNEHYAACHVDISEIPPDTENQKQEGLS